MVLPKLPILTPRRGRHVLLLSLPLYIDFLVLGRVEHGFRLLRRHSGDRFGGGRLVLTWRRRWTLRLTFATTAASASTTTAAPSAFLLPQRGLVVPPRIGIGDGNFENLLVPVERAVERNVRGILLGAPSLEQVVEAEVESRVVPDFRIL